MLKNGTCQIVDDSGCDLTFWYGYDDDYTENDSDDDDYYYGDDEEDDGTLVVWTAKIDRVCPPSEVSNHQHFYIQIMKNTMFFFLHFY